jgi:hypothetical protein
MRCTKGSINHCKKYETSSKCSECEEGFLIGLSNQFCLPRVAENCLTQKSDKDECLECKSGFWMKTEVNTNNETEATCVSYTVKDCLEYSLTEDKCLSCSGDEQFFGKYLDSSDGKCKEHRAVSNCVEYYKNQNGCSKCKTGYYIDPNDIQLCHKNPNGIENCSVYVSESECRYCSSGLYYEKSKKLCNQVTTPINKCLYYDSETECGVCDSGFIFVKSNGIQVLNGNNIF